MGNCIGKGQFGSVYRALDLATGEIVAVKRLLFEDGELDQEMMVNYYIYIYKISPLVDSLLLFEF